MVIDEGKRLGRKCFDLRVCIIFITISFSFLIVLYNILKTLMSEFYFSIDDKDK